MENQWIGLIGCGTLGGMNQPSKRAYRVSVVPDSTVLIIQPLDDGKARRTDILDGVGRVTLEDHDTSYRGSVQWLNSVAVRIQWSDPGTQSRVYIFDSRADAVDFKTSVLEALGWSA